MDSPSLASLDKEFWVSICLLLGYMTVGVVLGVVYKRIRPIPLLTFMFSFILVTAVMTACPPSWRSLSWRDLVDDIGAGLWYTAGYSLGTLALSFTLGIVATEVLPKMLRQWRGR